MNYLKAVVGYLFTRFSKVQLGVLLLLVGFVLFVGDSNIFARIRNDRKISELNDQIDYYHKLSETNTNKLKELKSDRDNFEKFARENYLMKKSNEDVFVIE